VAIDTLERLLCFVRQSLSYGAAPVAKPVPGSPVFDLHQTSAAPGESSVAGPGLQPLQVEAEHSTISNQ
jgi:hypothetical protein